MSFYSYHLRVTAKVLLTKGYHGIHGPACITPLTSSWTMSPVLSAPATMTPWLLMYTPVMLLPQGLRSNFLSETRLPQIPTGPILLSHSSLNSHSIFSVRSPLITLFKITTHIMLHPPSPQLLLPSKHHVSYFLILFHVFLHLLEGGIPTDREFWGSFLFTGVTPASRTRSPT